MTIIITKVALDLSSLSSLISYAPLPAPQTVVVSPDISYVPSVLFTILSAGYIVTPLLELYTLLLGFFHFLY